MSDLVDYDRVCSIEGGIKELSQEAAKTQEEADQAMGKGGPAPTPTATIKMTPKAGPTPNPRMAGSRG